MDTLCVLETLPPFCMNYTARDESRVTNRMQSQSAIFITKGEAECYICHKRQSQVLYLSQDSHKELHTFIQSKWQCFFQVLYCIL